MEFPSPSPRCLQRLSSCSPSQEVVVITRPGLPEGSAVRGAPPSFSEAGFTCSPGRPPPLRDGICSPFPWLLLRRTIPTALIIESRCSCSRRKQCLTIAFCCALLSSPSDFLF